MAPTMEKEDGRRARHHHVMMLPSLGHGHLIPFMQLAQKLAARGFTVTFVVTFHHKSSLQKKVEAERETGLDIRLVEMEIPRDDLAIGMLNSNSGMYAISVWHIICDVLPRNLPRTLSGRYILPGLPKEVRLTSLQMMPHVTELATQSAIHQFAVRQIEGNKQSWRMIANTFYALELDFVEHFQKINGTLLTIGPLLPTEAFQDQPSRIAQVFEMGVNTESNECLDWLDAQAEESVLYISFGSENSISSAQTVELAMGLQASGVKFVWVLRIPSDAGSKAFSSALDFLPEGFHGRMVEKEQGFIILGWAPQLSILAHAATAGFLSHCGWNAVLETITMGIPMIAWPLFVEQHCNSKFVVEEIQIALEAPNRAEQNWPVPRDDVERIVKLLMMEEKGRELKKRVTELKVAARAAVAEGGSSHLNFDLFVSEIMSVSTC